DVAAGRYSLGVVGTRVFDTLGVDSFQALSAPLLIDSYPMEQAVIDSGIPARMMSALDKVGVTGLGVLADGLRKPIAVRKPLLDPADWRGITFAAFRSRESSEAIRALGAMPSNLVAVPLDQALDSKTVQGFEANLRYYGIRDDSWRRARFVTANVNLWPQTLAVIANPPSPATLTPQQRAWLTQAVRDTAARSTGLAGADAPLLPRPSAPVSARPPCAQAAPSPRPPPAPPPPPPRPPPPVCARGGGGPPHPPIPPPRPPPPSNPPRPARHW